MSMPMTPPPLYYTSTYFEYLWTYQNLLFIPFLNLHNIKGKKVKYNFKMKSVKLTVFLSTDHFVI